MAAPLLRVSIALPDGPPGLYREVSSMLYEVLDNSHYDVSICSDGDETALTSDILVLLGDCHEFQVYPRLLGTHGRTRPITALWMLDTLPPAKLDAGAARIASRAAQFTRLLSLARTVARPLIPVIPPALRRRFGLAAYSKLSNGLDDAVDGSTSQAMKGLDIESQYELVGRYEWISRNYPKGWLDSVFVSTMPKKAVLDAMSIPSRHIPFGYHPSMGMEMNLRRDIDVLLIGDLQYGRRRSIAESLQRSLGKRGIEMTIVGGSSYGQARTELLNRAKISLNIPRFPWDMPAIRLLISMSCGAMVISEEMGDTTPFVPGRHFGQAGLDGLADLVEYYLGHDSERQAVVREALQFITRELTFRDSVTRILDSCSSQRPPGSGGCPTR